MDESCIPKVFSKTWRDKKLKQYKVTNMKNKYNVLCIEIRLLILFYLIISSFFCLSNFQFILIYFFSSDSAIAGL